MSTFPDGIFQYGGMPVGGGQYGAMWGSKVLFVDYDNGAEGGLGTSPKGACKYLQSAIDLASAWDVIYVRPRTPDSTGGDPARILPLSTTNNSIAYTKHGISIIGTGTGQGSAGQAQTVISAGDTTTTTPALDIKAPFTTIENIGFKPGASTVGHIWSKTDASTRYAFQNTFYKCWFRDGDATHTASGALVNDAAWYDNIIGCTFSGCARGIVIGASNSTPAGIVIRACDFDAAIASVTADIYTSGAVTRILITKCNFNHVLPTGGSPNKYVSIASASTGLISDSYFGVADATIANSLTLNGIGNAHLWGSSAEIT